MADFIFESKNYKDSIVENKLLHALLYGISKTLDEKVSSHEGYSTLARIGKHMIKYLKRYGFKPTLSRDPYERIVHLCKFYTDEGMVKKIVVKMTDNTVQLHTHGLFGSPVFADLHLEKKLRHIRPCPLLAMILSQSSEIQYVPEIKELKYDKKADIWDMHLEIMRV